MNKSDIKYICEASDEAIQVLYLLLSGDDKGWEQNLYNMGLKDHGVYLGDSTSHPNMVSIRYIRINTHIICFYHGDSMQVDHSEITEYMGKNYPNAEDINLDSLATSLKFGRLSEEVV